MIAIRAGCYLVLVFSDPQLKGRPQFPTGGSLKVMPILCADSVVS
jgi:hypothetical protein